MKRLLSLLLPVLLLASCASARYAQGPDSEEIVAMKGFDGSIRTVTYPAREKRISERRMVVYLPASYDREPGRRYPVLYLLHGARGNETTWNDRGQAFRSLDSLVRLKEARECIVVLPNMNRYFSEKDYGNGRAVNPTRAFWLLDGEAERHFVENVVRLTDRLFRTIPSKEGRAIAGMSSGGLQAIYLSAGNPDLFGYVGLFSPYAYPTFAALGHRDVYSHLWKRLGRQFVTPPQDYRIMIGRGDIFYPHMRLYDRRLSRRGYAHSFTVTEGGHAWYNWKAFLVDFYGRIFKEEETPGNVL